ncbi:hypothetical protein RWX45_04735, partial [Actinomyces sp. MRS3W]|nr:hypothetical protein [Actinomyces sp. MRS3W]
AQGQGPGGKKPVTKQWWFWTIIAVVVLALIIGIIVAVSGGDDEAKDDSTTSSQTQSRSSDDSDDQDDTATNSGDDSGDDSNSSSDVGTTMDNPGDPQTQQITFTASEYATDPDASMEVQFGSVEWDASADVEAEAGKYSWEDPGSGNVYMRVPVTVTYHGKGQMNSYELEIDYVKDGNTTEPTLIYVDTDFRYQDMPRDGGSATGYFMFIISEEDAKAQEGVFAVSGFNNDELYMQAKSW